MGKVLIIGLAIVVAACCPGTAKVIYVDEDANAGGDGTSWATAYRYLQDALTDARGVLVPDTNDSSGGGGPRVVAMEADGNDVSVVEVRVAQGLYLPDHNEADPNGTADRLASFGLLSGLTLVGGYAGLGSSDPNARDPQLYESILSGDLAGNDVLSEDPCDFVVGPDHGVWPWPDIWNVLIESTRRENSVHILVADQTDDGAVVDGFTITGGNAYYPPYWQGWQAGDDDRGGAILQNEGDLTVRHCIFAANSAMGSGGALYSQGPGKCEMIDCRFSDSFTWQGGGAVENRQMDVAMSDCVFERNGVWEGIAAAMSGYDCRLEVSDCRFSENAVASAGPAETVNVWGSGTWDRCVFDRNGYGSERSRGAMNCSGTTLTDCLFQDNVGSYGAGATAGFDSFLVRCRFINNHARRDGGGLYVVDYGVSVVNSLFAGNTAARRGGATFDISGYLELTNCTFSDNRAEVGGGALLAYLGAYVRIANSIFRHNVAPEGPEIGLMQSADDTHPSTVTVSYSLTEHGQSSISKDSLCTVIWGDGNIEGDPCFAAEGLWDPNGTPEDANDDVFIIGDYHLKSQAGRWLTNKGRWMTDDVTSACIDAGNPTSATGLEPLPNGGRVNMGVYGGTWEASRSWLGRPPCGTVIAGDINGDCRVDFADFTIMALHWMQTADVQDDTRSGGGGER